MSPQRFDKVMLFLLFLLAACAALASAYYFKGDLQTTLVTAFIGFTSGILGAIIMFVRADAESIKGKGDDDASVDGRDSEQKPS